MPKVIIELEIKGDAEDALTVVENLLDNGVPQDSINDHDCEDAGELKVKNAICYLSDDEDEDEDDEPGEEDEEDADEEEDEEDD